MPTQPVVRKRRRSTIDAQSRDRLESQRPTPNKYRCNNCSKLSLEELLEGTRSPSDLASKRDSKIADVGLFYRGLSNAKCDLCCLFSNSRLSLDKTGLSAENSEDSDELHCLSFSGALPWVNQTGNMAERKRVLQGQTSPYLVLLPSNLNNWKLLARRGEEQGFLVVHRLGSPSPDIFMPQVVGAHYDASLARSWIQYCKSHHMRLCSSIDKPASGLRLIDCHSLMVVTARDDVRYAALSYVWGLVCLRHRMAHQIQSFEVRLKVTMDMGFQYLWVDKFCIDQDDNKILQAQIKQMDLIYRNAELAIIAAAGQDPSYGLPGVGRRPRTVQPVATVGCFEIISTMQHPHVAIQSSKWAKRAWTFQEAILSRRRLVFTDEQVYFECNGMNCQESVKSSLDKLHVRGKSKFRNVMQAGVFGRTEKQKYGLFDESTRSPVHNFLQFIGMVEQYTAREMTHDADSLAAFSGIIRNFETQPKKGVRQIWGVPFRSDKTAKEAEDSFVDGLAWNHKTHLDENADRPQRRLGFPSWSWAGWAGEVEYHKRAFYGTPRVLDSWVNTISIELGDGSALKVSDFLNNTQVEAELSMGHVIQIHAIPVPLSHFLVDTSSPSPILRTLGFPTHLALSVGPWGPHQFLESLKNQNRQCVCLGSVDETVFIMVLQRSNDIWSRIGMLVLDAWSLYFTKAWIRREYNLTKRDAVPPLACLNWNQEREHSSFRIR